MVVPSTTRETEVTAAATRIDLCYLYDMDVYLHVHVPCIRMSLPNV